VSKSPSPEETGLY